MPPLISIITVVKNNKEFIEDAIKSVLSQTYPLIEYLVIDGSSNDGTINIIKKHENRISRWVSEPDEGIYDACNKGLNLASGDIIGFLHSDDLYADENVIEKIAAQFNSVNVDAVYSNLVYVSRDNENRRIRYWNAGKFSYSSLKFGWMPPHTTLFVRKSIYERTGLYNTKMKIASDYDWMLRFFALSKGTIIYIDEVLVKMRIGGKSNSILRDILLKSKEDYKVLKNNNFPLPFFTLFLKNIRKINQFLIITAGET